MNKLKSNSKISRATLAPARSRFAILMTALALSILTSCSTAQLERHAENPNDPHAEASDSDKCCLKWEGSTCLEERRPGCADRLAKESIQHGLDFPSPATVAPAASAPTKTNSPLTAPVSTGAGTGAPPPAR